MFKKGDLVVLNTEAVFYPNGACGLFVRINTDAIGEVIMEEGEHWSVLVSFKLAHGIEVVVPAENRHIRKANDDDLRALYPFRKAGVSDTI